MKPSVTIARLIVGILFIFSGLIKANDPLSLSYKMQEFFEIWNTGLASSSFFLKNGLISVFDLLHEHSLFLSIVMIAFEIIAGVALLLGWRMKLFSWLLLLLIIFFTFLTGYAYLSGKFKNCGCFGDCIPITVGRRNKPAIAWFSFLSRIVCPAVIMKFLQMDLQERLKLLMVRHTVLVV
ncbi:MAG: MauE/DoxX family redox-associated membrane protein [Chitinophagaceae bacterium]